MGRESFLGPAAGMGLGVEDRAGPGPEISCRSCDGLAGRESFELPCCVFASLTSPSSSSALPVLVGLNSGAVARRDALSDSVRDPPSALGRKA
jgi:hypothetical protein